MWPGGIDQTRTSRLRKKTAKSKKTLAEGNNKKETDEKREGSTKREYEEEQKDGVVSGRRENRDEKTENSSNTAELPTADNTLAMSSYVTVEENQMTDSDHNIDSLSSVNSLPLVSAAEQRATPVSVIPLVTTPVTELTGLVDLHNSFKV